MVPTFKARALLVAVSNYLHVSSLPAIVHDDATALAGVLADPIVCGYAPGSITTCLDGSATLADIRREFDRLETELDDDETFLFYFSGHGHRDVYGGKEHSFLMAQDSDLGDPKETGLSDDELLDRLRRLPSKRQVIVLDACHAGGMGTLKSAAQPQGLGKAAIDSLAAGRGRALLTSSRAEETSLILAGATHSLFTDAILEGLRGGARDRGDGTIGVLDLFSFVAEQVPRRAAQHPVLKADELESNFPVALVSSTAKKSARNTRGVESDQDEVARAVGILAQLYPLGPMDADIWRRAGGDPSRLTIAGHGRAQWHGAIRAVSQGGGGLRWTQLLATALDDFPESQDLQNLSASL